MNEKIRVVNSGVDMGEVTKEGQVNGHRIQISRVGPSRVGQSVAERSFFNCFRHYIVASLGIMRSKGLNIRTSSAQIETGG